MRQKMWHEEVEVTVRFLESRKDLNRAVRNRQVSEGQDKVEQSRQVSNACKRSLWRKAEDLSR